MFPVRFSPDVGTDLVEATTWYDQHQPGLGDRFLTEFRVSDDQIADVGRALRKVHGEFRRLKFGSFPYLIFFRDDGDGLYVTPVINAARDPALVLKLLDERR